MRWLACIMVWLLLPTTALAQEKTLVRSGEHDGFSRLVLERAVAAEWDIVATADEVTITFPDAAGGFDTSRVFDLIPRTRIAEVADISSATGAALKITLACICHAEAFEIGVGNIVVDIKPGAPDLVAALEDQTENSGLVPPQLAARARPGPSLMPESLFAPGALDLPDLNLQQDGRQGSALATAAETWPGSQTEPADPADFAPADAQATELSANVAQAQLELLVQLARAADQGLIEFAPPDAVDNSGIAIATATGPLFGAPVEPLIAPAPDAAPGDGQHDAVPEPEQVLARTAIDREAPASVLLPPAQPACLVDSAFDIAAWADERPFHVQVSELRAGLLGEFDRPEDETLFKLARTFVYFGFGTEATNLLAEFAPDDNAAALLADLAAIVEGQPPARDGPVLRKAECPGAVNLWRALAGAGISADAEAILHDFSQLPVDLRRLTGPWLARRLLDSGQLDRADLVLSLVERVAGDNGQELELVRAILEHRRGNPGAARPVLEQLANLRGENPGESLLELAELLLIGGVPVPEELLTDVAGLAFLYRGSPAAAALRIMEIRLRAGSDSLLDALNLLQSDFSGPENSPGPELVAGLFLSASPANGKAADYVAAVLTHKDLLGPGPEFREARLDVAQKLRAAGMPGPALEVLAPLLAHGDGDALVAAARAELDMSQAQRAFELVRQSDHPAAAEIRSQALSMLDASVRPQPAPDGSGAFAWVLGDWRVAAQGADGPRQKMAEFMLERDPPAAGRDVGTNAAETGGPLHTLASGPDLADPFAPEPSLESARIALQNGADTRQFVSEALDATRPDDPVPVK